MAGKGRSLSTIATCVTRSRTDGKLLLGTRIPGLDTVMTSLAHEPEEPSSRLLHCIGIRIAISNSGASLQGVQHGIHTVR